MQKEQELTYVSSENTNVDDSKHREAVNRLPIRDMDNKFELLISDNAMGKIKYLCEKIPSREWSGVIFYTEENSINDIENLKITVVDLFPLDIGTVTYTEYMYSSDLAGYIASNLYLMDMHMGMIHSHNNMGVFFSGTDNECLAEQAPLYKTFLSVIVNNKLDVKAALAVHSNVQTTSTTVMKYQDLNHSEKETVINKSVSEEVVLKYKAKVLNNLVQVEEDFVTIVNELLKNDAKHSYKSRGTANKTPYTGSNYPGVQNYGVGGYPYGNNYRVPTSRINSKPAPEPELPFEPDTVMDITEMISLLDNLIADKKFIKLSDSELEDPEKALKILNSRINKLNNKKLSDKIESNLPLVLNKFGYNDADSQYEVVDSLVSFLINLGSGFDILTSRLINILDPYLYVE